MTQEEKQLLIKDLCGRLPYGVKVDINFFDDTKELNCSLLQDCIVSEKSLRPYLRPMSSMTEEETKFYTSFFSDTTCICDYMTIIDWLNAHHFDYRWLIEKGFALEAPDDMYR